ncbi:hypothetical protein [Pedobacter segetis]|uniref:hypothetical protein n=1 Tax=Pedobacter segetis TaxID=2793069 RepID=UPI001909649F|nr:hypothetical protein [Pedobacter segetis]
MKIIYSSQLKIAEKASIRKVESLILLFPKRKDKTDNKNNKKEIIISTNKK